KQGQSHDGTETHHGSLLEDMYGVESRENQPRKRIKTVDPLDGQQQQTKRRHFSIAGDSGLGEWMKEDQGEYKQSSPATPNVVDLTLGKGRLTQVESDPANTCVGNSSDGPSHASDDDDLQVTGSVNLSIQRVCYGKLENAMIQ